MRGSGDNAWVRQGLLAEKAMKERVTQEQSNVQIVKDFVNLH